MNKPRQTSSERVYEGRLLRVDLETFTNPAGQELSLELIRHPGAAAVVPIVTDEADPEILMIRQFRYASGGIIWEIPAGVLEPGEAPEVCAHRELKEETGATASRMEHLTTIFTTPGFTDEEIHLFAASDLTIEETDHQLDEFIEVRPTRLSTLLELIRDGEIEDGKTIVALLYVGGFKLGL